MKSTILSRALVLGLSLAGPLRLARRLRPAGAVTLALDLGLAPLLELSLERRNPLAQRFELGDRQGRQRGP